MASRNKGRRAARRRALGVKVKTIGQKAAPIVRKAYEKGGADLIEVGVGLIPVAGPAAGKVVTKALDAGLMLADKRAADSPRKRRKAKRAATVGRAERKVPPGEVAAPPAGQIEVGGEVEAAPMWKNPIVWILGILGAVAVAAKKKKR